MIPHRRHTIAEFSAESNQAQRDIQTLRRELTTLRGQLDQTERSTDGAGNEIDQLGDEAIAKPLRA